MKKHFAILTATLLAMTLGACNTTETSTSVSTSITTSTSTSSVEASTSSDISSSLTTSSISSSISSSSSSASTSSAPKEVQIGEYYESHSWDLTIKNMTKTVLGDFWEKVPVFNATRYEAVMGYVNSDILTFRIVCFGVNSSSATRLYKEKMEAYGYYFSAEGNYGYQMVDYYSDLFLSYSFEALDVGDSFFVIQANIQQTREVAWNSVIVDLYTDISGVPACPAESYSTSYDNTKDTLTVFALFVDKSTVMSKYINELYKVGFTVKSTDQYGVTTLIDESGYLTVQLYLTYGDYDCDALYINFVNIWPSVPIASFTNLAQFPRLTSDTALYDGYTYIDPVGNNNEKDFTLCIYYKSASTTDYENYVSSVINLGFTKGEVETTETGIISTYLNAHVPFSETEVLNVTVRVLYQISSNMICIVFYQANVM